MVNRSHTQIYYGDVSETDVLSYRDDGYGDWAKARKKRINRLSNDPHQYSLNDRDTCFRLFDLATIYSFLASHVDTKLSEEEMRAVSNAKIHDIPGNPPEREALMIEIQENIIQGP